MDKTDYATTEVVRLRYDGRDHVFGLEAGLLVARAVIAKLSGNDKDPTLICNDADTGTTTVFSFYPGVPVALTFPTLDRFTVTDDAIELSVPGGQDTGA